MSTSSRFLNNALFNLLGGIAPALVTIFTLPFIVARLGDSAYGVLTLVTSIIGYFALLDINVTAGSVKFVAEHHATGDQDRVYQTITFGLWVYLVIGLVGLLGVWTLADVLVTSLFNIPAPLHAVSTKALHWAALGFLLGQLQAYLQSVPQALQRYDISGRIEAVFGVIVPLLTVALLALNFGLVEIVILRVAASSLHCVSLALAIRRLVPGFRFSTPSRDIRLGILSFSAFSFLSRVAALSYAHADKLLIGAMIGVEQVTYFAVASTLANRVMSLTGRLSGVIFPMASALAATNELKLLERLYIQSSRYLLFINGGAVLLLACFAAPILHFWMGARFAEQGALIMAVVALSQLVDSLTNIPSLVNDGLGHPRVSGLFAVTRALLGLAMLYVGVLYAGSIGAAWAHFWASVLMTAAFVCFVHGRTVPIALSHVFKQAYATPTALLLVIGAAAWLFNEQASTSLWALIVAVSATCAVLAVTGFKWVLHQEHSSPLSTRFKQMASR
jgi:O-antigen/teichoic acid export membrane protein